MLLPFRIRQDLRKSQVFYLAICRATASYTVFWVLSLQSLAPPTSLSSSFHIPRRFVAPRTSAWDLKRKVALHHAQKLPASHKSHLQVVASKVSLQPSSSLLLAYLSPNIWSSGARDKFRDEPELSPQGTGNNNPPSTHHAQVALGLALTAEKQVVHHLPVPSVSEGEGILPVQWTGLWGLPLWPFHCMFPGPKHAWLSDKPVNKASAH